MSSQPVLAFLFCCHCVHVWVYEVTWRRGVDFDRLVNGRYGVVADRVGSILRRVVTDRGCLVSTLVVACCLVVGDWGQLTLS